LQRRRAVGLGHDAPGRTQDESPNAGFPEAAAAGALGVQLGGASIYFGKTVEKPTLGDAVLPLSVDAYRSMIRLMYVTSLETFLLALGMRLLLITG
jgi:adenosylcobinamide-phosphate synthase